MKRPALMMVTAQAFMVEGIDAVLLRDKEASPERLLQEARRLREATRGKALLIIHTHSEIARQVKADGVHYGAKTETGLRPDSGMIVGRSVHSVSEARRAASQGADYVLAGTIFPSQSHPGQAPVGLETLSSVCASVSIPVLAIGGVTPENTADCLRAGCSGVAALSPFLDASSAQTQARRYRQALESVKALALTINGKEALIPRAMSIEEFLSRRGLSSRMVAVEHNREIVDRNHFGEVVLAEGDALEIVQMTAGG